MAKITNTISSNSTVQIGTVDRKRDHWVWQSTFFITGLFNSGTISLYASPDGGTTKVALPDLSGTAITANSNTMFNVSLCTGSHNSDKVILYATLTSATGTPSVTITYFDNN